MKLKDFRNHVNKSILDRGYDYYVVGNIIENYNLGDGEYIFMVQGSEVYEVTVQLNPHGEMVYTECNCPYDFGPICKHQVAAYFELIDILDDEEKLNNQMKTIAEPTEILTVLNNLSKDELINIILDITRNDRVVKNNLISGYTKPNDSYYLDNYKILLNSIVEDHSDRRGFIACDDTFDFINDMTGLIDRVNDTDNKLVALDIVLLTLEEAMEALGNADDSYGAIDGFIFETIELIRTTIINCVDMDIKSKTVIMNKMISQIDSKVLQEFTDYKIELLEICVELTENEDLRQRLKSKIESMIYMNTDEEYSKYTNERLLLILYNIIVKHGSSEDAEAFIINNLNYTLFRELYIDRLLNEKNYNKVIELALEGEEQDKQYAGLISKWKKLRYTAYKALFLVEEQAKLAMELLLDGDFGYYKDLIVLTKEDKKSFYNNLKLELKKDNSWQRRAVYLKLIEDENDHDEILTYVKENPFSIQQYAEILAGKFKEEIINIYKDYIKSVSKVSSNRSNYKNVCRIISGYKKVAGKSLQEDIVKELIRTYQNRPAFRDELSKIK